MFLKGRCHMPIRDVKIKAKLSNIGLLVELGLPNGHILRVENDDWGKFIRVVDNEGYTVYGELVVKEDKLDEKIKEAKNYFK